VGRSEWRCCFRSGRGSRIVTTLVEETRRCRAQKERPMVPVPIRVMLLRGRGILYCAADGVSQGRYCRRASTGREAAGHFIPCPDFSRAVNFDGNEI